jgi:hypothetical protein
MFANSTASGLSNSRSQTQSPAWTSRLATNWSSTGRHADSGLSSLVEIVGYYDLVVVTAASHGGLAG